MPTNDSVQMRACVLREPGTIATETVSLAAPRAGEVRVRIAAAGVCHSDLHLADGKLGDGRWPIVLGHEGAGVVDAVGEGVEHLTPGDHVVLAMVVPCGQCDSCRVGHRTLCEPAGARAFAGVLADGSSRLTDADGAPLQHCFSVACFAEHAVVAEQAAIPIPANLPLWQAALVGCGPVRGFGPANHAARVGIGERVCVVGCGGVGMQAIAAARLAGAAQIIAVDLRAEKLDHAIRRGAPHTVPPGGTAVVVGLAPVGVEVALPAIEFLSEKRIVGSYYGSADPALSLRGLVDLASAGRLPLGDMVSHFIQLHP